MFDVGANVGQSAGRFLEKFPKSKIYCFEPAGESFNQLQESLRDYQNVHSFKLAFGATKGKGKMVIQGLSKLSSLSDMANDEFINDEPKYEEVDLTTVDEFCADNSIYNINYLKIDTEGSDLEILKGANNMLNNTQIDLVQVEAGMNIGNKRHVPFEVFKRFLEERGYYLFGIYDQAHEWPKEEPHLRRTNSVFVSDVVIRANRK